MKISIACIGAALLAGALSTDAGATVVRRASFAEYCREADVIVRARVTATQAVIPTQGPAHTLVDVHVTETFKGEHRSALEFTVLGARSATFHVRVAGAPTFEVGDEAILFLDRTVTGRLLPLGQSRGVRRVPHGDAEAMTAFGQLETRIRTEIGTQQDAETEEGGGR